MTTRNVVGEKSFQNLSSHQPVSLIPSVFHCTLCVGSSAYPLSASVFWWSRFWTRCRPQKSTSCRELNSTPKHFHGLSSFLKHRLFQSNDGWPDPLSSLLSCYPRTACELLESLATPLSIKSNRVKSTTPQIILLDSRRDVRPCYKGL